MTRVGTYSVPVLLVGISWLYTPGLADAYALPKVALLRVGAVAAATWALWRGQSPISWNPRGHDIPVLAFAAVQLIHTIFSLEPHTSFFGQDLMHLWGLWTVLALAALYWVVSRWPKNLSQPLSAAAMVAGAGALAASFWLKNVHGLPSSTLGLPLHYAGFLAMMVPVWAAAVYATQNPAVRLGSFAGLAITVLQLMSTVSRSAYLGAFVGLGVLAMAMWRARKARPLLAGALGLCVAVALGAALKDPANIGRRVANTLNPDENSASTRIALWKTGLSIVVDRKGLGSGLDTFGLVSPRFETTAFRFGKGHHDQSIASYAHNEIIQYAVTTGVLGLGIYFWLLASFALTAWRKINALSGAERARAAGLLAACAALWVHSQFNFPSVATAAFFWAFMGVLTRQESAQGAGAPKGLKIAGAAALALSAIGSAPHLLADRAEHLAWEGLNARKRAETVRQAERAYGLNPYAKNHGHLLALAYRARARKADGSRDPELMRRAVATLEETAKRKPNNALALHNYAMGLMWIAEDKNDPKVADALKIQERAVIMAPFNSKLLMNLGEILHFKGEKDDAKRAWIKAMDLNPFQIKARQWLARYRAPDVLVVSPQDIWIENFPLGQTVRVPKAIKVASIHDTPLEIGVTAVPQQRTLYLPPEGYVPAPKGAVLSSDKVRLKAAPDTVTRVQTSVRIPNKRKYAGKKFTFFVRLRSDDFGVPLEHFARINVATQGARK